MSGGYCAALLRFGVRQTGHQRAVDPIDGQDDAARQRVTDGGIMIAGVRYWPDSADCPPPGYGCPWSPQSERLG